MQYSAKATRSTTSAIATSHHSSKTSRLTTRCSSTLCSLQHSQAKSSQRQQQAHRLRIHKGKQEVPKLLPPRGQRHHREGQLHPVPAQVDKMARHNIPHFQDVRQQRNTDKRRRQHLPGINIKLQAQGIYRSLPGHQGGRLPGSPGRLRTPQHGQQPDNVIQGAHRNRKQVQDPVQLNITAHNHRRCRRQHFLINKTAIELSFAFSSLKRLILRSHRINYKKDKFFLIYYCS